VPVGLVEKAHGLRGVTAVRRDGGQSHKWLAERRWLFEVAPEGLLHGVHGGRVAEVNGRDGPTHPDPIPPLILTDNNKKHQTESCWGGERVPNRTP